ncbi:MAG: hypothetical protein ACJ8F7_07170 [Gemmataceae bacterium]
MSEDEWIVEEDLWILMRHVESLYLARDSGSLPGFMQAVVTDRKPRLFACAACRYFWSKLTDERGRRAVEVAERFADKNAEEAEIRAARAQASQMLEEWTRAGDHLITLERVRRSSSPDRAAIDLVLWAVGESQDGQALERGSSSLGRINVLESLAVITADRFQLARLLRDLFGNPYRPSTLDPAWLAWRDSTAVKLAQTIYDDRRFDLLPILADALHAAGCCDDAILDHCRGPGPHVRGCWVVNLLLGKS